MVLQNAAQLNKMDKIAPPGPLALPFVGMSPFLKKHLHLELYKLAKKYGNIFQLRVGGRTLVVLSGLETIREALVKQQNSFNARADFGMYQRPALYNLMESKSGEFWKKHHDIAIQVMHTFLAGKSDTLETWVLEDAADLANIFLNSGSQSFDPNLYLPLATLSFTERLMLDKRGSLEDSKDNTDLVTIVHSLRQITKSSLDITKLEIIPAIWRPFFILSRWRSFLNAFKAVAALNRYVAKNVEQHQESFDPENLRDITDGLLKASSEQTESDRKNFRLGVNDIVIGTFAQFSSSSIEFPRLILHWCLLYMIAYPTEKCATNSQGLKGKGSQHLSTKCGPCLRPL